jgi:hypothetical protein
MNKRWAIWLTKLGLANALAVGAGTPTQGLAPIFSGCIVYETEYQTAAGEILFYAVKPKSWFYIQGSYLKSYDRKKQLEQLYLGDKSELYRFEKGQAVLVPATDATGPNASLTCLPTTATILGHRCQVLRTTRAGSATLVFYSPDVRVNALAFSHSPLTDWYALLQATDGALPLRIITVDAQNDITVTREAIEIRQMPLVAADFTITAPAR